MILIALRKNKSVHTISIDPRAIDRNAIDAAVQVAIETEELCRNANKKKNK